MWLPVDPCVDSWQALWADLAAETYHFCFFFFHLSRAKWCLTRSQGLTLILLSPTQTLSLSAVLFLPPSCHLCTKRSGFALTLPSVLSSSERRRAVYADPDCLLPFHCFSRKLTEGQAAAADGFGKLLGKCLHLGPLPHLRMP